MIVYSEVAKLPCNNKPGEIRVDAEGEEFFFPFKGKTSTAHRIAVETVALFLGMIVSSSGEQIYDNFLMWELS